MSSGPIEGLIGWVNLIAPPGTVGDGTLIGHLLGVELSGDRSQTQFRTMGTYDTAYILKGRRNFEGSARKAFICGDLLDLFRLDCTEFIGSFYPRGGECGVTTPCGTFSGTIAFKSWRLTGWESEAEAAKIEEVTFDIYNITHTSV